MSYSGLGIIIGVILICLFTFVASLSDKKQEVQQETKQEIQQETVSNRHLPTTATRVKNEGNDYYSYCLGDDKILFHRYFSLSQRIGDCK